MTTDWWSPVYDYPRRGLAPGEVSLVVAEITVNKYGGFAGCVGHAYLGNPQMGPYVCSRLQKRGEFEAARGPDGKKVIGIYRKLIAVANIQDDSFSYRVSNYGVAIPLPVDSSPVEEFEIQFFLDASGRIQDCSLIDAVDINLFRTKQVVEPGLVSAACAMVPVQMKPVPPRDHKGQPIPTTQNALFNTYRSAEVAKRVFEAARPSSGLNVR
ncbi:MAG: hypothetical protein ABIR63_07445 [Sphingomicrobium sp.]